MGASLVLNPLDRSVVGWSQMLVLVLLTMASALTGVLLLLFASKEHPHAGNVGWMFIVLSATLWADMRLALWIAALLPLFGIWRLVGWFRQKSPASDSDPTSPQ